MSEEQVTGMSEERNRPVEKQIRDLFQKYLEASDGKAKGDAWQALWEVLWPLVSRIACLLGGGLGLQPADIENLAHDTCCILFKLNSRQNLSKAISMFAWIYTVCRHQAFRIIRKNQRMSCVDTQSSAVEGKLLSREADPLERLVQNNEAEVFWNAIEGLDEHDRTILTLRYVEGMEYAQIAEQLKITKEAARKRSSRAQEKLRIALGIQQSQETEP
jgi:RNA polymerase sigma factor (sigma-70 family)